LDSRQERRAGPPAAGRRRRSDRRRRRGLDAYSIFLGQLGPCRAVAPQIASISTPRDPDTTFAYFGAAVPVHGKSSARLDLQAQWEENVDDPAQPGPTTRAVKTHVFEFNIHLPSDGAGSAPPDPGVVPVAIYDASSDVVTFQAPAPDD